MKTSHPAIAIVGMSCVYPHARTPGELWENVLAQRRAFRRLPSERMRAEDYWSADTAMPDHTYSTQAAVISDYEFDRVAFRVVGSTYRSADLAHWLALDVASRALADAGFAEGRGLPRETTGVLLGNTLTGEFSRAGLMRLRWPYVRRVVEAALGREKWEPEARRAFLDQLEADYKSPFPAVGEESLAGGLSNTIAGRICNQFDLKGGGYTVDGACSSSLLAVANACAALSVGDLDVALAGGVDLSLDPFELVGFAKTGALARDEMRVYDRRSSGFWPGEGCGFVTLMRHEDALAQGSRVYAVIRGWGISSDGSGGITRPEAVGQIEALRRAYRRAGFGIDTVEYFEGHGTGTAVGDATELEVISQARREAKAGGPPAAIGSIKANIGHTKAAAGIAGLLKAVMAVHVQVLPPTTGFEQPHEKLTGAGAALRLLREPEPWPEDRLLRAAVSAMGFGGINAHVVLESVVGQRRSGLSQRERQLARSWQDAELFLLAAAADSELAALIEKLLELAPGLSLAEMTDLAAQLQKNLRPGAVRAAIVASKPAELAEKLRALLGWLHADGVGKTANGAPYSAPGRPGASQNGTLDFGAPKGFLGIAEGVFLGSGQTPPRLAFLFPGQGSPTHLDGGIWRRRFESVRNLYARAALPKDGDTVSTRVMQPAVVTASLAGLRVLEELGIEAAAGIGHSLGEMTALHWAGAMDEETLLRIARVRGAAMSDLGSPTGGMAAIGAPWQEVRELIEGEPLSIVGFNSPRQTVVAGDAEATSHLALRARARGWAASPLAVSHAFHTPLVAAAVPVLAEQLARERFGRLDLPVFSTILGGRLAGNEDIAELLCRQVTSPVQFSSALGALLEDEEVAGGEWRAASDAEENETPTKLPTLEPPAMSLDLLIEVGPGVVLTGLAEDCTGVPAMALDAGGPSLKGLLQVLGAAFVLGAPVRTAALFSDRFARPFDLEAKPKFFVNPCELAPVSEETVSPEERVSPRRAAAQDESQPGALGIPQGGAPSAEGGETPIELVRQLVADRAELPVGAVQDGSRMLSDLHLNSITVGQLVSEAARRLGLPRIIGLTDFANASVAEMARALEGLKDVGGAPGKIDVRVQPAGIGGWFESFSVELVEAPRPRRAAAPAAHRESPAAHLPAWQIFAPDGHSLAKALRAKLAGAGAGGVMVCLPETPTEDYVGLLLEGARALMEIKAEQRFVLVQHGWGGAGFARTLHLETPGLITCVINLPASTLEAADWAAAEALSASGFVEAHYDVQGRRREPRLKWLPERRTATWQDPGVNGRAGSGTGAPFPIGPGDILLVSGGGKGIAAECALALGRATGAKVALMGRSDPATDQALRESLSRITAARARCCYVRADVCDGEAVRRAVTEAEAALGGRVTALLHAAGANSPQLIGALDLAAFQRTLAPKIQGLRNLLAAIDADRLRLLVTFSSIIARTGLRGEADYATANEWLGALTEEFQSRNPQCRCHALEWSVWSGVGMGARLGKIESLIQQGITPIPPEEGVRILVDLVRGPQSAVRLSEPHLANGTASLNSKIVECSNGDRHEPVQSHAPVTRVVTGRFGEAPTVKFAETELPLRRFLEKKRVHYPGVELIVDAELSLSADPYLADHVVQKEKLLPAVMGLEAMAQTAMALAAAEVPPNFEKVELARPVIISDSRATVIRLVALRRAPDLVEVCLRSEETDYQVDHFRAFCRFGAAGQKLQTQLAQACRPAHAPTLEPRQDLYGRILFHTGRFCRLERYQMLSARECIAEISPSPDAPWFGTYLPGNCVLGDPGARDAALHAIQACIPHRRILPTGIESVLISGTGSGPRTVRARERLREGNNFTYDLEVTNAKGDLIESWRGLRLRAVEEFAPRASWPGALLGPYLERRLEELVPQSEVRVVLERNGANGLPVDDLLNSRAEATNATIQQALGRAEPIWRRADGKPLLAAGESVSAAHWQHLTLAVASEGRVACDLELVSPRTSAAWRDLLGEENFKLAQRIAREQTETAETAATRVWSAVECMKKCGLTADAPLVLGPGGADGWLLLRAGALTIVTCATAAQGNEAGLIAAIAVHANGALRMPVVIDGSGVKRET